MLKKIIAIKNVGRFRNSDLGGNTTLSRYSFIHGANGFGKTTVCSILRSLKTGDASYLIGRRTLGVTDPQSVDLLTGTGTIHFNGVSWSATYPDLAIFDGVFVAENVHFGDIVDTNQKRSLYRVIVGETGVILADEESQCAADCRAKTTEITNAARAIQPHLPAGMTLDSFLRLESADVIEERIATQESTVAALREASGIAARSHLYEVVLPAIPEAFAGSLARSIEDISTDAELQIKANLEAHGMAPSSGTPWIVQGLNHTTDSCPFCAQKIEDLPLIAAYRAVFSARYRGLRDEIAELRRTIANNTGEAVSSRLRIQAEQHANATEFWNRYCALTEFELGYPASLPDGLQTLSAAALSLIERKECELLAAIQPDEAFTAAFQAYEAEKIRVEVFNRSVREANALIDAKKAEVQTGDMTAATNELARLKAIQKRYDPDVAKLCDEHIRLTGLKDTAEALKNRIRQQLDQHTASVLKPYENRINDFLEDFNAGFKIAETKHSYVGGVATSSYQLVINQVMVDIGTGDVPASKPSFKNTLSAGDRSTLALAFFLAHLEHDSNLASKIVVFDDPFNSQDAFRRTQTIHEIIKLAGKCLQVIVLSHDANFLKLTWGKCPPSDRAAVQIADHGQQGSKIIEIDLEKACQGRTATDIDDLQAYVTTSAGQHIDIIRKMRTVLETYMRTTYTSSFEDGDWLGDIVSKVRTMGSSHPAHALYDRLNAINDYTAQYHHGENVADTVPDQIDATELRGFAKQTLRIVNALQA
jgi:wobble nucleotide-excising tRNase